jgi:hypothetical protein
MPREVALSCNLSYWEARIGDGYEQPILNQPWETWLCGRIILSSKLVGFWIHQEAWHSRILAFQDNAQPPSVDQRYYSKDVATFLNDDIFLVFVCWTRGASQGVQGGTKVYIS